MSFLNPVYATLFSLCVSTSAFGENTPKTIDSIFGIDNTYVFSSDADMQTIAFTQELNRLTNLELGLNLGDSLWVNNNGSNNASRQPISFFYRGKLNQQQTATGLPAYAELLRLWYNGYFDHFHSWASDNFRNRRQLVDPAASVKKGGVEIVLSSDLYFNSRPHNFISFEISSRYKPKNFHFVIEDGDEKKYYFDETKSEVFSYSVSGSFRITIDLKTANTAVKLPIKSVRFFEHHCEQSDLCVSKINAVMLNDFSRTLAEQQFAFLSEYGVRPFYSSSHGGSTGATSYSRLANTVDEQELKNPKGLALPKRRQAALAKKSPYFHGDLLQNLGTSVIWTLSETHPWSLISKNHKDLTKVPSLVSPNESGHPFWRIYRHSASGQHALKKSGDFEKIEESFGISVPCGKRCGSSSGNYVDVAIAQSLLGSKDTERERRFLYTHFGSTDGTGVGKTVDSDVETMFEKMADHVYEFGSDRERFWVGSSSVWLRYSVMKEELAAGKIDIQYDDDKIQIAYDPSKLRISRAQDYSPSTLLNGFTFVADTPNKTIYSNGMALKYVQIKKVKNKFQYSIIDGDNTVPLIDELDNPLSIVSGRASYIPGPSGAQGVSDGQVLELRTNSVGQAKACVMPKQTVPNPIAYSFAVKDLSKNSDASVVATVSMKTTHGSEVVFSSSDAQSSENKTIYGDLQPSRFASGWQVYTARIQNATKFASFKIKGKNRRMLPIGTVEELCVELKGSPNTQYEFDNFIALRPSNSVPTEDGSISILGKVHDQNGELLKTPIGLTFSPIRTNSTSETKRIVANNGFYIVPSMDKGVYKITAQSDCGKSELGLIHLGSSIGDADLKLPSCPR